MTTSEEQRAAEYRLSMRRRRAYREAVVRRLAGSPAARLVVERAWNPLLGTEPGPIGPMEPIPVEEEDDE